MKPKLPIGTSLLVVMALAICVQPASSFSAVSPIVRNLAGAGGSPTEWTLDVVGDENFRILYDSNVALLIDNTGRIGIGIVTPDNLLHIAGDVTIDENLYVSGTITTTGTGTFGSTHQAILGNDALGLAGHFMDGLNNIYLATGTYGIDMMVPADNGGGAFVSASGHGVILLNYAISDVRIYNPSETLDFFDGTNTMTSTGGNWNFADGNLITTGAGMFGDNLTTQRTDSAYNFIDTYNATPSKYPRLYLRKSRGGTLGTVLETADDDWLGILQFMGCRSLDDAFANGARIVAQQDGGSGLQYVPTNLTIETCGPTGYNVDQFVLHHDGGIGIGGQDTPAANTLDINDYDLTTTGAVTATTVTVGDNLYADNIIVGENLFMDNNYIRDTNTVKKHIRIPASNLGRNPTNPPVIDVYGICHVAEFTVDTDKAYYKINVPPDIAGTTAQLHFHWTRSTTGSDESGERVNWQVKYLSITEGENVHTGEATENMEDIYEDVDDTGKIVYKSDTIELTGLVIDDFLIMELSAIASSGSDLSEPALLEFCIDYDAYQVQPPD